MLEKDDFIMDVEQTTVENVMRSYGVRKIIHGHTHRPQNHEFEVDGISHERLVLGDWYDQDSTIFWQDNRYQRCTAEQLIDLLDS